METKQDAPEQPRGNQRENKKLSWKNWKWKHFFQNLWNAAKSFLRGKFTVKQAYRKKQEKSQINNLTLKELEKENKIQSKPKKWNSWYQWRNKHKLKNNRNEQ